MTATLVGAANPEPRPTLMSFSATTTSSHLLTTTEWFTMQVSATGAAPHASREPYRTTAWVGGPVPEIEA